MKYIKVVFAVLLLAFATSSFAQTSAATAATGTANAATGPSTSALVFNPVSNYAAVDQKPNSVFAPSFNNTANCVKGASFGIAVGQVQLAGGGGGESDWCQNIREVEVAYVIGGPVVGQALAMEVACNIPRIRKARLLIGNPCTEDTDAYKDANKSTKVSVNGYTGNDPLVIARIK